MSEYTTTTSDVRSHWCGGARMRKAAEFDAWLATHDAEVAATALLEAADEYRSGQITGMFLGRDDYPRAWLRDRADQIKTETKERN